MADINITRHHHFTEVEVGQKVCELAQKLVNKHGGSYQQRDDGTIYYSTTGVDASVAHDADTVTVAVTLGFLMKGLSGLLKEEIEGYLDRYV